MRPDRFVNLLIAAVGKDGKLSAYSYPQTSATSLWGFVVRGHRIKAHVQVCARSALGDDYAEPEHIVTGDHPFPPLATTDRKPMRDVRPDSLLGVERYLSALAVDTMSDEVTSIHLYSTRPKPGAIEYGATFVFCDGSGIFMYVTAGG